MGICEAEGKAGGIMEFEGFPKEFPDFFFLLPHNNNMESLPVNKVKYKSLITEPLTLLYHDLIPVVHSISETAEIRPSKCISTMYNDMRFSGGTPLKTYMYLRFREPFSQKDVLGLYFDMGEEYYSYGIRIYKQTSAGMEKIRAGISPNRQAFREMLEQARKHDMAVMGDKYAKDHYPDLDDPIIKDILNRKNFYIGRNRVLSDVVFSKKLLEELSENYYLLKDFYLLWKKSLYG